MSIGKVWLVGAGPGDAGLFTLKGLEVLNKAEVVVYDSLVGQGVLTKIPDSARLIYVGKRADKQVTQLKAEVERLKKASAPDVVGRNKLGQVVRLLVMWKE